MTLTQAEMEARYDATRLSPITTPAERLADYAASPEARALYDTMSPEAQRIVDRLIAIIDRMPDDEAERAIDLVRLTLDDAPPAA